MYPPEPSSHSSCQLERLQAWQAAKQQGLAMHLCPISWLNAPVTNTIQRCVLAVGQELSFIQMEQNQVWLNAAQSFMGSFVFCEWLQRFLIGWGGYSYIICPPPAIQRKLCIGSAMLSPTQFCSKCGKGSSCPTPVIHRCIVYIADGTYSLYSMSSRHTCIVENSLDQLGLFWPVCLAAVFIQ